MFPLLLLLPFLLLLTNSPSSGQSPSSSSSSLPWICPGNGAFFDSSSCDPNSLFSCPAKSKCRLALKRAVGVAKGTNLILSPAQEVRYLCCDSRQLGIQEWLLDSGLSPAIFPQVPNSTLWQVILRDPESARQAKVDENGADLSMLGTDPGFGNFSQLEEIDFGKEEAPPAGGFLHILEAINQLAPVSALRLHFDYPSFGSEQLDLLSHSQRFPRGFSQSLTNGFVPANDFYRRQHVLLVFKSELPLANRTADIERWMGWSEGKFPKLMWDNGSGMPGMLGKPLAGFMFNLTTRGSLFPVNQGPTEPGDEDLQRWGSEGPAAAATTQPVQAVIGQLAHDPGLEGPSQVPAATNANPIEGSMAQLAVTNGDGPLAGHTLFTLLQAIWPMLATSLWIL